MPKIDFPLSFIDPIDKSPIWPEDDPVTIKGDETGQLYKRATIATHFACSKVPTNPKTNEVVKSIELETNTFAKQCIKEFIENSKACTQDEFSKAVKGGRLADVNKLNFFDRHLVVPDKFGQTPLHIAASKGFEDITKFLIAELVDLEPQNDSGLTPLHQAINYGNLNIVKLFISKNKYLLQTKTKFNSTVLHLAAQAGNSELVELFLAQNVSLELSARDADGYTPLYHAANRGCEAAVKLLMMHKVDITEPLLAASDQGYVNIAKLLLSNVNLQEFDGLVDAFYRALLNDHEPLVRFFLEKRSDLLLTPIDEKMPLHVAAELRKDKTVKLLLEKYEELQILCNDITPLELAIKGYSSVEYPFEATIKLLITKLPKILLSRTSDGQTALHIAAKKACSDILKMLLKENVDIDAQDNQGNTPLHCAAKHGCVESVESLLVKGADYDLTNKNGLTPMQVDSKNEVIAIFRSHQLNYKQDLIKKVTGLEKEFQRQSQEIEVLKKQLQQVLLSMNKFETSPTTKKTDETLASLVSITSPIFKASNEQSEDVNSVNAPIQNYSPITGIFNN